MQLQDFIFPVWLSLKVSVSASIFVFVIGISAAWWMSQHTVRGRTFIESAFMLPLVLPPTVVGFVLLVSLGRRSPLGRVIESLFGHPVIFTWWAAVLASAVVAFPLVYQTIKTGFQSIDEDLIDAGRSIGAGKLQVLRHILLPLSLRSLVTAFILGFARSLGEFGATLMVAGNIPHQTQTMPTAIYIAVDSGNTTLAWLWTGTVALVSFLMLFAAGGSLTMPIRRSIRKAPR